MSVISRLLAVVRHARRCRVGAARVLLARGVLWVRIDAGVGRRSPRRRFEPARSRARARSRGHTTRGRLAAARALPDEPDIRIDRARTRPRHRRQRPHSHDRLILSPPSPKLTIGTGTEKDGPRYKIMRMISANRGAHPSVDGCRLSAKPRQPRTQTRVMRSSRLQRLSATLGRGCEAFGRGRVREEQQVEQARRIEVGEVRLGESAEGGLVGGLVAGELERVAVGDAFPATGDGG